MNVKVVLSAEFSRQFKRLAKKYKSLGNDYLLLGRNYPRIHFKVMTLEVAFARYVWLWLQRAKVKAAVLVC